MKQLLCIGVFCLLASLQVQAQSEGTLLLGAGADALKTDNDGIAGKFQIGLEANYFLRGNLTGTVGLELWSEGDESLVLGSRYYFNRSFLARVRGLIGANDLSVGAGITRPIRKNLNIEGLADFYFDNTDIAFRVGLTYALF